MTPIFWAEKTPIFCIWVRRRLEAPTLGGWIPSISAFNGRHMGRGARSRSPVWGPEMSGRLRKPSASLAPDIRNPKNSMAQREYSLTMRTRASGLFPFAWIAKLLFRFFQSRLRSVLGVLSSWNKATTHLAIQVFPFGDFRPRHLKGHFGRVTS